MAGGSIKLFQFNQQYFQAIGIKLPSTQNRHAFNCIQWIFIICFTQFPLALLAFLFDDADSMGDYAATFYILICLMEAMVVYITFNWKLADILMFTENCEQFIANSMLTVSKLFDFSSRRT